MHNHDLASVTVYSVYLPKTSEFSKRKGPAWGPFYTRDLADLTLSDVRKKWPGAQLIGCAYEPDALLRARAEIEIPQELAEVAKIKFGAMEVGHG